MSSSIHILNGDCRELVPDIAHSIDLVVTSPPYFQQRIYDEPGLGNERTLNEYLDNIIEIMQVLIGSVKETGSIVINMGDKFVKGHLQLAPYRFAIRVQDELGLQLINTITWVKSNPTPRTYNRRLVPSTEPCFHFALSPNYYYDREKWSANQDTMPTISKSTRTGESYRMLIDTSLLDDEERENAHSALDEAIREVQEGEIHSFRMKIRGIHALAYGGQAGGRNNQIRDQGFTIIRLTGQRMKRDVLELPVANSKSQQHPAPFPVELAEQFITMLCPPSGTVLDPFCGGGSTLVAAYRQDRTAIGIDINDNYCKLAEQKLEEVA